MSLSFAVGDPAYSSTPKSQSLQDEKKKRALRNFPDQAYPYANKMSSSKTVQRTVVEKSYSSSGSRSYVTEPKVAQSSYQLRFGARKSGGYGGVGYRRSGGMEASITRVTASDGLELTPNLITTRAEEKAALGSLNDRFVTYIDKVRGLVTRNQVLEAKVKQLESCQTIPSRAGDMYDEQLHRLQKELEITITQKTQVELELEACCRDLDALQKKLQREIEDRKEAENEAKSLCKDVDQATLVRVELEGKVESLREELDLVRRANDEDIRVLTEQLAAMRGGDVVLDGSQPTDLSESLRDIRAAYEQLTQNNKFEIEGYYKSKIADLTSQLREENSSNKNNKSELMETKRQLQSLTVEVDGMRTSNVGLENQLEETENRYQAEILNYQNMMAEMEQDLNNAKDKVQRQLVDYNELLNVKLSLDLEIQTYRKLLEGEENRISVHHDSSASGSLQVNVVERVVTEVSDPKPDSNRSQIDDEMVDMLSDVVKDTKSAESTVEEKKSERRNSSSSSSSSSSDSESEI